MSSVQHPGPCRLQTPRTCSHQGALSSGDKLCSALKDAFGPLDCDTPQSSFTNLPNDRFSHATAYQYFAPLESLAPLITYAQRTLCPDPSSSPDDKDDEASCAARVGRAATASTLDLSYDTISHALKATATWARQPQALAVSAPPAVAQAHRVEVGVLSASAGGDHPGAVVEPHEIGMGGVLTVLGQDKKPSPVVFKFPARHRRAGGEDDDSPAASFRAEVVTPAGLHPTLRIELHGAGAAIAPPPGGDGGGGSCALHAYFTLPRAVFADRYQLADPLFLASRNLSALRWLGEPVDLEAPEYVVSQWGSAALVELAPPGEKTATAAAADDDGSDPVWTAEMPLHLRYLRPAAGGYRSVEVPWPAVFWACTTEEGTKFPSSPFERVNLGYDGLFGPRTVFWHVDPRPAAAGGRLASEIRVPVLDADRAGWVGAGTAAAVLLGLGWIVWKLAQVYLRTGYGPKKQMEGLEKKKQ